MINTRKDLLEVAARIGDRLCSQADWSGGECCWKVFVPDPLALGSGRSHWVSANGSLYQGTAGIGLFLGELYLATLEARHLRGAIGAMAHAMAVARTEPPSVGFYSGTCGIAYAVWRLSHIAQRSDLLREARFCTDLVRARVAECREWDYISGMAGAIPALLAMADGGEETAELAESLGTKLLSSARSWTVGSSWVGPVGATSDLAGLGHGAAGGILGLLVLYSRGGKTELRYAAEDALDYEDIAFSPSVQNWRDFRHSALAEEMYPYRRRKRRARAENGSEPETIDAPHMVAWCHGAAGIGLSRLLGHEITGSSRMRREAVIAVDTTLGALGAMSNYSLCHGVGGNSEALALATEVLGDPVYEAAALDCARDASRFELTGIPWRGGAVGSVADASLMSGEAGIGYWYLRLAQPDTPPILYIKSGRRRHDGDSNPTEAVRRQRIQRWLGNSMRVLEAFSPTWSAPDVTSHVDAVGSMHGAILQHVCAADKTDGLLQDGVSLDIARTRVSRSLLADLTVVPVRRQALEQMKELDWGTTLFVRAPEIELVETNHDWARWLSGTEKQAPQAEATRWTLVSHEEGRVVERAIGALAAAVLQALASPAVVQDVARRLAIETAEGVAPFLLVTKVAEQVREAYLAGLVVVSAVTPDRAGTTPMRTDS